MMSVYIEDSPRPSNLSRMELVTDHDDSKRQSSEYKQPTVQVQDSTAQVDYRRRPVDKSKTGTWKAAPFIFALNIADFQGIAVPVNLVPWLATTYHQPIHKAANITTNLIGTSFMITVLGGFLADSYIGCFYTICAGGISMLLGLGLLTFVAAYHGLRPAPCTLGGPCKPAGAHYMAPLFVALYTYALGTGMVRPNIVSLGGDQFDDSSPKERKQSVSFFVWLYLSLNIGSVICFALGVYLQDDVSRTWGYAFVVMFYFPCFLLFLLGATKYRLKLPSGSFISRMAQVIVASLRKWKYTIPADPEELYSPVHTAKLSFKLSHTSKLRFFDKAAIIDEEDKEGIARGPPDLWRLCSVTQVEECKRYIQFLPIWITTAPITIIFAQIGTFSIQQGATLDRKLGPHFTIPPAALTTIEIIAALVLVPIYGKLLVPFLRRFTKTPYGLLPLQRLGLSLFFAIVALITCALVERKRLTYVRELHYQDLHLGAYVLPMKFWYVVPQFVAAALMEMFLLIPSYQFYYHEAGDMTRSVASSFTYSANALGYFFSTVLVNITNSATSNDKGGSWLKGQLNNGGLEKWYWFLALFLFVDSLLFILAARWYTYKYNWYNPEMTLRETDRPAEHALSRNHSSRVGAEF